MNPYEAPDGDALVDGDDEYTGQLSVKVAFNDGFDAMKRNFLTWLLMGIALFVVTILLECTLIGILALPSLMWGAYRYSLDTLDGEPELSVLWSGFSDFGKTLIGMGGAILLLFLSIVPGYLGCYLAMGVGFGLQMVVNPDPEAVPWVMFGGVLAGVVVLVVGMIPMLRIYFNVYYVVDQGMGPWEATVASYHATRGQVLKLLLLFLAIIGVILVGELMLLIGVIPAVMIQYGMLASAYRQLSGTGAAASP